MSSIIDYLYRLRFLFAYRGYFLVFYGLCLFLVIFYQHISFSYRGVVFVILGSFLRFLCGFYIDGHSNETKIKAKMITKQGVYAWVRNPLYLSNLLVSLGVLLSFFTNYWLFIFWGIIWAHHSFLVVLEERYLLQKHKFIYLRYCLKTPRRFFSFRLPKKKAWSKRNNWKVAFQNQVFNILKGWLVLLLSWNFSAMVS